MYTYNGNANMVFQQLNLNVCEQEGQAKLRAIHGLLRALEVACPIAAPLAS